MANNKNDAVVANNRSGGAQEEERERERRNMKDRSSQTDNIVCLTILLELH